MSNTDLKSNNTAKLLFALNKQKYKELEDKSGELSHVYNLGNIKGPNKPNSKALLETSKLTLEALSQVIANTPNAMKSIKRRLRINRNIELIPEVITMLLGSSLWIYLSNSIGNGDDNTLDASNINFELYAAIGTTFSGIVAVFLNRGLGLGNYNTRNIIKDNELIISYTNDANRILRYLGPATKHFDEQFTDLEEFKNYLREANELSGKLTAIIPEYL